MIVLGIESSCDETAAAIIETKNGNTVIRSSIVLSQIPIHRKFGGVVPEVAARKHVENILPVIDRSLVQAKIKMDKIDRIAVTRGPGLITSLMVGVQTAKSLAYIYNKPLVGINHLEGHLLASLLGPAPTAARRKPHTLFPAIGLIASGGHTEIILVKKIGDYKKIGQTLDDAAGECFDKAAKILNLGYPGGPEISKLAKNGNPQSYKLPRPMIDRDNFDFSFSGLKTSILYFVQKNGTPRGKRLNDFCASVESAIIDVLISKTFRAAKEYKAKTIIVGGGVVANKNLRQTLKEKIDKEIPSAHLDLSALDYCGDNAAMIALAGAYAKPPRDGWKNITVDPNLEIGK
ncbi:MAG: tRNA (adenosine(37)-N6)-threonylcarbamoyltransferase complex transferase subunit TsaD [Patescibacteria group bacterium]|jgi:N6-L-threonylcarbamoyladenine synthase